MDLQGKVALVTGGGTGVGRAISLALARAGVGVAINYSRSEPEALATAEEIRALGVGSTTVQADVSRWEEAKAMVDRVAAELGRLDILVNNAGTSKYVPLEDLDAIDEDLWDRIMAVNTKGTFLCSKAAVPYMKRQGAGKIINTASDSALMPEGSCLPYCVSKAGVVMITKCLARALAPQIQVNALAPGYLQTRWFDRVFPPEAQQRILSGAPPADLEDVARAALMLATADSITGQTVVINNGDFMH
ncbi:MAG: SDR family NAD(P)-dependent oxidoreductase [Chloroflexi bacterium]|nr:SDR family NAD(P)-dependent oxidoreductase [Chloroflexota bacterium]